MVNLGVYGIVRVDGPAFGARVVVVLVDGPRRVVGHVRVAALGNQQGPQALLAYSTTDNVA